MGGVRAELAVERPANCMLSDVEGTENRRELLARGRNANTVSEEFVVEADSLDAGANGVSEVYAAGDDHVYRFEDDAARGCPCESVEAYGCPVVGAYVEGETLRVTFHAPDSETLRGVVDAVRETHEDVRVERLLRATDDGFELAGGDALTERQRELMSLAVANGYYDTPRGCTLTDLADAANISKSTASAVLHRAEGRLVKSFFSA